MSPRHTATCQTSVAGPPPEGRVHLPIANTVNAMAAFGGLAKAELDKSSLPAAEACNILQQALDQATFRGETLSMAGVTGPGDPLATAEATITALRAVHAAHPELGLCLRTNGLSAADHAQGLAEAGVSQVFLDVDAVEPELLQKLFAWIRPGKKTLPRAQAAALLVEEQSAALAAFKERGIEVIVRTTVYPGINDEHVEELARRMAELGADALFLAPWELPEDAEEEKYPQAPASASPELMAELRAAAGKHLPVLDTQDVAAAYAAGVAMRQDAPVSLAGLPKPSKERPNVAVATSDGFDVNMHLGQTRQFLIYGAPDGPPTLLGSRPAPWAGKGDARWMALAEILSDCSYLLVAHAGENPEKVLGQQGLRIVRTESNIESIVDHLYGGGKKKKCRK